MSIIRGSGIQVGTSNSTTLALPSGTQSGDLAILYAAGGYAPTLPSGWTSIYTQSTGVWTGYCASRTLTSGDISAGSVTISFGGSYDNVVSMVTFVGNYSIRESEDSVLAFGTEVLTMSGSVLNSDVGIYWATTRGGGPAPTITPTVGYASVLQADNSTNGQSVLSVQQPVPGGTMAVDYHGNGIAGFAVQIILITNGILNPIQATCSSVPNGVTGSQYSGYISVSGGYPPYCVEAVDPTTNPLPPGVFYGVFVSGNRIPFSGVPLKPGTYTFTLNITDSHSNFICITCTITVTGSDLTCICGSPANVSLCVTVCYTRPFDAEKGALIEYKFPFQLNSYFGFPFSGVSPNYDVVNEIAGTCNCDTNGVCQELTFNDFSGSCAGVACTCTGFAETFICDMTSAVNDPTGPYYHNLQGLIAALSVGATNTGFLLWDGSYPSTCDVCYLQIIDIFLLIEFTGGGVFLSRPTTKTISQGSGVPVTECDGGAGSGAVPIPIDPNTGQYVSNASCSAPNECFTGNSAILLQWAKGGLEFPAYVIFSGFFFPPGAPPPCPDCTPGPPLALTANCSGFSNGQMGSEYFAQIFVYGGTQPYFTSLAPGSQLPPGLILSNGTVNGIPSVPGEFTFTIDISDSSSPPLFTSITCSINIIGLILLEEVSPFSAGQFRKYRRMGYALPENSTILPGVIIPMASQVEIIDPNGNLATVTNGALNINANVSGEVTAIIPSNASVDLTEVGGSPISIGQQLSAASLPVVLPTAQITALTPPTTVTTSPPSHASTNVDEIGGAALSLGQQLSAASIPVVLPAAQITTLTPPTTVATTPPSHASTNIDEIGGAALSIGQQLAAASVPVVLPAAQITALTPPAAITNYAEETGGNLATLAGAVSSSKFQDNLAQVGGNNVAVDAGIASTGTLRVVQASANVANITQVSIPTTVGGIQVIAANANRMKLRVTNTSTNPVWISTNSTPTIANGDYIPGIAGYPWVSRFEGALYAISTDGTALVTVYEESSS